MGPAAALAAALWTGAAHAEPVLNGFDLAAALVPPAAIERGGPPKDGIPANDQPRFVPASTARLVDDDRVLGLVIGGQARAYPVRIFNGHEVVNDRFDRRAVRVSCCPLCCTGMAFDAPAGPGGRSDFGVSGLLCTSDVLLHDRATGSLWSQILGQAVTGPRRGARLQPLPLVHTGWAGWRARHPRTQVLSTATGFVRDDRRDPYAGCGRVQQLMFDLQRRDGRFPLKEWVLGVTVGGEAKAYPFSRWGRAVDPQGRLRDRVGGQALIVHFDAAHATAEVSDAGGQPLPSVMAYWFAWVAFHPQTAVLAAP